MADQKPGEKRTLVPRLAFILTNQHPLSALLIDASKAVFWPLSRLSQNLIIIHKGGSCASLFLFFFTSLQLMK